MSRIRVIWSQGEVSASLHDTPTARHLLAALPVESRANVWGDEVYFGMPFSAEREPNATDVVDKGTVCFWLDGDSLALLFGPTPVSRGTECRLISDANVVGQLNDEPETLRSVRAGETIRVEAG